MRVLVGITGGIAAYKSAELIRLLVESGHEVRVVPTPNALRFIGSATLEALSHNPVHSEIYDDVSDVRHIELAKWAQCVVVAPATASFLARSAIGLADDLLGNVILAATCPKLFAPAMHSEMWINQATVENVSRLREQGIEVMEPASGRLTGSDTGVGRLPEASDILAEIDSIFTTKDLSGKTVLVIAGGTREPVDAVRYIGNRSSGKQGIALAEVAKRRGADVTLIAANFQAQIPGVQTLNIETVDQMQKNLADLGTSFDYILMPAAVSDYRVANVSSHKLKKSDLGANPVLPLVQNPDVIASIAASKSANTRIVGFAAETATGDDLTLLAKQKLRTKHLDLVVANDVSGGSGFDSDSNRVLILSESSVREVNGTKRAIAVAIFDALLGNQ